MQTELKLLSLVEKVKNAKQNETIICQPGDSGQFSAPSNIALVKYWGKQNSFDFSSKQQPLNSSLSFSLPELISKTTVTAVIGYGAHGISSQHTFQMKSSSLQTFQNTLHALNHSANPPANQSVSAPNKLNSFLKLYCQGWADETSLEIVSENNFPAACGIASSASGYAALVGALHDLFRLDDVFTKEESFFWRTQWARIGSGSACRSVFFENTTAENFVAWQLAENNESFVFAPSTSEKLQSLAHRVVVLSGAEKEISSSQGHELALTSPLHPIRLAGIELSYNQLLSALRDGDFETIAKITEQDAFAMHAVMMSATPACIYFKPQTTKLIAHFVAARNKGSHKVLWTVDAGPNVHFLADSSSTKWLDEWLDTWLNVEKKTCVEKDSAELNNWKIFRGTAI